MNEEFGQFDLDAEIRKSQAQKPWPAGKQAKTLVTNGGLRVALFTLEQGATIHEHQADGPITVQVLRGEIRFRALDQEHSLRAGELLTLGPSIKHAVESVGESAFLLTISRPNT